MAGLAILAVPWVDNVVALGFLLALAFCGNDLAMAPAWAAAADIGERYTGTLAGAMNMIASFMAAIQAIAVGRFLDSDDLVTPFMLLAISLRSGYPRLDRSRHETDTCRPPWITCSKLTG